MYIISNGRWCDQNGEPLNAIDLCQLSVKINCMKPLVEFTDSENLLPMFYVMNSTGNIKELFIKIVQQKESIIELVNNIIDTVIKKNNDKN